MKFSGALLDEGVQLLERTVIPACQKTGKKAFLLLSGETVSFVQDEAASGGMIVLARVKTEQLFDASSFFCSSRTDDVICLCVPLDVLLKALRSAGAHGADAVDISLKCRSLKASPGGSPVPLIELRWRNDTISIEQEIPIEKPCVVAEVRRIRGLCETLSARRVPCAFYVDVDPAELSPILGVLDSMRSLSTNVILTLTRGGDFCLVAQAGVSVVGVTFPKFDVFDRDGARMIGQAGGARTMDVRAAHLSQALKSIQLTSPTRILCGVSDDAECVHVIPSYKKEEDSVGYGHGGAATWALDFRIPAVQP